MALGSNLRKKDRSDDKLPSRSGVGVPGAKKEESSQPERAADREEEIKAINNEVLNASEMGGSQLMLIVFRIGTEEYALPIESVREVVKTPHIARIPQLPAYIRGVANVRGNVVAVLDLAIKMNHSEVTSDHSGHLLILKDDEYQVAIGIDQVPETLMVRDVEIDHSSEVLLHMASSDTFIQGIVKKEGRMIILLDIIEMVASETFTG